MNFLSAKKKQWPHLQETILNIDWLAENEKTLKEIYPKHYTSMRMICPGGGWYAFELIGRAISFRRGITIYRISTTTHRHITDKKYVDKAQSTINF